MAEVEGADRLTTMRFRFASPEHDLDDQAAGSRPMESCSFGIRC
jgi:hypothetical protein